MVQIQDSVKQMVPGQDLHLIVTLSVCSICNPCKVKGKKSFFDFDKQIGPRLLNVFTLKSTEHEIYHTTVVLHLKWNTVFRF